MHTFNHNSPMDDLDHRLIALLRTDSRAPTAALAKGLRVSRGTVQNRIDRLRASGVLLGFTIRLAAEDDPAGVRAVMTIIIEGGRMAAVLQALSGVPAVTATHTTNGRWDLVAELEARDLPAFSAALDAIRAIPGISATETSLLLKTTRF
jgi:DNA-binding Lrp family transcriptional regulator